MARADLGVSPNASNQLVTKNYVDTAVASVSGGGASSVTTNTAQAITGTKTITAASTTVNANLIFDNANGKQFAVVSDTSSQFIFRDVTRALNPLTIRSDAMADAITLNSYGVTLGGTPGVSTTPNVGDTSDQISNTRFVTNTVALKANIASPTFTGTPAAPTPSVGTSTTQIATAAMVTLASGQTVLNAQTAAYTPVLADAGKLITEMPTAAVTVTIPLNSVVAYPVGTVLSIANLSAFAITLAGASGVTLNSPAGLRLTTQYAQATLTQTATNVWLVAGQTVS
jgi:hypothetical protein